MLNEEILTKIEDASDDEVEIILENLAKNESEVELDETSLEEVTGGASIRSITDLYRWYNSLSQDKKKKFKNKLKQMIRELSRFGNVKIPY